jgi:hypothetical protein
VSGRLGDDVRPGTYRAEEAIRLYWDELRAERFPTATLREIEVELPA